MAFSFRQLKNSDVVLIEPDVFGDERGFFAEIYKFSDFKQFGINKRFVQTNHSKSARGVLRGLHYQLNPAAQGKLVYVVAGEIFDAAVDIRKGSPGYGKWVGEVLSSNNKKMLYIPEGFAHGFCVLSDTAEMIYYCTKEFAPELDRGIIWNDSKIKIDWPVKNPILSEKDAQLPVLEKAENNFVYNPA